MAGKDNDASRDGPSSCPWIANNSSPSTPEPPKRTWEASNPFVVFKNFVDDQFRAIVSLPSNISEIRSRMQEEREAHIQQQLKMHHRWTGRDESPDYLDMLVSRQGDEELFQAFEAAEMLLWGSAGRNKNVAADKIKALFKDDLPSSEQDRFADGPMLAFGGACYYRPETGDNLPSLGRGPTMSPRWLSVDWFKKSIYSPTNVEAHPLMADQDLTKWRAAFEDLLDASLDKPMSRREGFGVRPPYENADCPQSTLRGPGLDWMLSLQCRGILPPQLPAHYDHFDLQRRGLHGLLGTVAPPTSHNRPPPPGTASREFWDLVQEIRTPPAPKHTFIQGPRTELDMYDQLNAKQQKIDCECGPDTLCQPVAVLTADNRPSSADLDRKMSAPDEETVDAPNERTLREYQLELEELERNMVAIKEAAIAEGRDPIEAYAQHLEAKEARSVERQNEIDDEITDSPWETFVKNADPKRLQRFLREVNVSVAKRYVEVSHQYDDAWNKMMIEMGEREFPSARSNDEQLEELLKRFRQVEQEHEALSTWELLEALEGLEYGYYDEEQEPVESSYTNGNRSLQDYQMQLMLLEQQNKKRLQIARGEQEGMQLHPSGNGQFARDTTPKGSRAGPSPSSTEMQADQSRHSAGHEGLPPVQHQQQQEQSPLRVDVLSSLTTTQTTRLPDGTVTTKVVLKQRFADGREETHESLQTSREGGEVGSQRELQGKKTQAGENGGWKGWFWR